MREMPRPQVCVLAVSSSYLFLCVPWMVDGLSGQNGQTAAWHVEMEHGTGTVLVLTLLLLMKEGTVRERERRRKTASPDTAQVSVLLFPCCCVYQIMKVEAILVEVG